MNLKKILIIFNPASGHSYPKNYQQYFLKQFKKNLPDVNYKWLATTSDFKKQLAQIKFNDFQRIIIVGGDGTIKDVANHLLTNNIDIPLAVIPQGSANVLASALNIPLTQKSAIKTACLGQEKRIDVGLLNNQYYFLICLAIGFWSKVVNETKRGLKIKLGFLAYLVTYFKQKKIRPAIYKFQIDGKNYQAAGNTFVIANAISLFKLKPKKPIDFYDGQFDILTVQSKHFWEFLIMAIFALFNKRFVPFLSIFQGKKIVIKSPADTFQKVQVDGEIMSLKKIEVEIVPRRLRIITVK